MSFIIQAGGTSANLYQATASGAIAKGSPVALNTNGTLSQCGYTNATPSIFTTSAILSSSFTSGGGNAVAFDPTSGTVLSSFLQSGTGYQMVVAGKITGQSITWGTPVVANSNAASATNFRPSIVWDSTNSKFVLVTRYAGGNVYAVVCTVTGTSVSVGSAVDVQTGTQTVSSATYDSTNSKVIVIYNTFVDTAYARVGTVSGTTISFGTAVQIPATIISCDYLSCSFNPAIGKTVILFYSSATSGYRAVPATTSGTNISIGTASNLIASGAGGDAYTIYDASSQNVIGLYSNNAFAITVSGTTATNGTAYAGSFAGGSPMWVAYDQTNAKINIIYTGGTANIRVQNATTSGTVITYQTAVLAGNNGVTPSSICGVWDFVNGRLLIVWASTANTYSLIGYGTNYTNFLGFATSGFTNGQQTTITTIGGQDANQTALTTASKYYVKADGTLSTTPDATTVYAGTALTATAIIVKGQP